MPLRLTDINEFEAMLKLANALPESEKTLFKALTGGEFNAEEFLVGLAEMLGDSPGHYLIWDGETPVAAGGFLPQRRGVMRTWFIAPDESWRKHGKELEAICRDQIAAVLAHRVETVTLADRAEARAFYERIGLTFESTLRGYGANGEDAVMYVAVRSVETN